MIVIVDSGSTKADWKFIEKNQYPTTLHTMGLNPYYHSEEKISSELAKEFNGKMRLDEVEKVYFYGAGCSDEKRNSIMKRGLLEIFRYASIEVNHDILASARATCKDDPGIACILGTGSNSCLYDGVKIVDNVTNLAYILGDEGSGSHLGKSLIKGYFYREFPDDIKKDFEREYGTDKTEILNNIYLKDGANVYLASFAKFLSHRKDHLYIQNLVNQAFSEFIKRHVRKYKEHTSLPIHFVGSIAYHFADILKMVLDERNLKLGTVVKKPIDNLVDYHLAKQDQAYIDK